MKALTGVALLAVLLGSTAAPALAQDLEERLEATLKGAWALTRTEVYSDCAGFYTNTEVHGSRATSKGRQRFAPGELARVEKLSTKSDRVDVYLILGEKVLEPRQEGPFTLFDERTCKVQLMVDVPKETMRAGDPGPVHGHLEDVLETFDSEEAARHSPRWNRRVREAYPEDYEETLQRHAVWLAEQENARVAAAREVAVEEAARAADRISDNPDYLAGLAAGIEAMRSWSAPTCSSLPSTSLYSAERSVPATPRGVSDAKAFARGFKDGQALRFHLELARRAKDCFVAPPPVR